MYWGEYILLGKSYTKIDFIIPSKIVSLTMDINIQNKKIELIQWLSTLEDISMIDQLMKLRDSERTDWWAEISKEERESIEQGIKDADEGKVISHDQAREIYGKWL